MKVNSISEKFYKNKFLLKGLEFASKNGALFAAGTSLTLSTFVRPLSIIAAPKTDKENKKIACVKSIASSGATYLMVVAASLPVARGVKNIDKNVAKYLKPETIKNLGQGNIPITKAKEYQFATQLFKLGVGFLIAAPKSIITCKLMPPILKFLNKKNDGNKKSPKNELTFKSKNNLNPISKGIATILNNKKLQEFAQKHKDSNLAMHILALSDTLSTATFIQQINKNDNIRENRKKILSYNSAIATGLSILWGYCLDNILQKPTEKFIKNLCEANKNSPKLHKYIEGTKIAKASLILGFIYYGIIPFISTFLAERINPSDRKKDNKTT